ncbi:hypothetical protein ACX8XP_05380 [Calditrichota bacterium LG25]
MKKALWLFLIFFLACATREPEPMNAQTLSEALQLAKQLNRPLLIDFMTDW